MRIVFNQREKIPLYFMYFNYKITFCETYTFSNENMTLSLLNAKTNRCYHTLSQIHFSYIVYMFRLIGIIRLGETPLHYISEFVKQITLCFSLLQTIINMCHHKPTVSLIDTNYLL